jgi:hypothetical protein
MSTVSKKEMAPISTVHCGFDQTVLGSTLRTRFGRHFDWFGLSKRNEMRSSSMVLQPQPGRGPALIARARTPRSFILNASSSEWEDTRRNATMPT